ncbi:tetratricopeptide repeat protein [Herbaspirillum sp. ST 5-3]|uniref:tetratricopeptide repeat protein n=1 Tax=Oxalobacteraceae TaxID=75682 RepID=UPI002495A77D|nr:tetratricopeptide repeat protein [Herbaspirillum sp. ST 5-3]
MNKAGRNDPCHCGSGRKYKLCCQQRAHDIRPDTPAALVPQETIRVALVHHQAGRLQQAAELYRRVLESTPDQVDALHYLGLIAHQGGRHAEAQTLITKAIDIAPTAPMYFNLGGVLQAQGKIDEAIDCLRRAVALKQDYVDAWFRLGAALHAQARLDDAIPCYRNALNLRPDLPGVWNNLGNALAARGRLDEAVECLQSAVRFKPDFADAYYNLGNALMDQGNACAAQENYRKALAIRSDYPEALNNLGNALEGIGELGAAENSFRRALTIKPDYPEAHYNLGNTLLAQDKYVESAEAYASAIALRPDFAEAHYNRGKALEACGIVDGAAESYRKAINFRHGYPEAHNNLGNVVLVQGGPEDAAAHFRDALHLRPDYAEALNNLGNALQEQGELDEALACYRRALAVRPDYDNAFSNLLLTQSFNPACTPEQYLAQALRFGEQVAQRATPYSSWKVDSCESDARPLRVGLVSGDLRLHPVGIFLESILANLDPAQVELFAYPTNSRQDELTRRIQSRFAAWHSIANMSDEQAARRIHEDGIHVLIDLAGHTAGNRLAVFAWKPAPIQVTWLGYFATTGMREMDYILCDEIALPQSDEGHFVEKAWYLPRTRLCFSTPSEDISVAPLPALAQGTLTFGCFNNLLKMNDEVVGVWARVLQKLGGSRLLLKSRQLNEATTRQRTLARFAAHGIGAERVLMEGSSSRGDYLRAYNRVDIALDPFPYTGGTTSVEGLWMGVPLVTKRGDRLLGRQGEGLLHHLGMADWIADDCDDYVAKAVAHAADLTALTSLRAGLRGRLSLSPLCDAPRFARDLEMALIGMWQQHCERTPPGNHGRSGF